MFRFIALTIYSIITDEMAWTMEKTEQLRKLWGEGHTASQISKMIGDGISRNAVIGKSHRLGLQGRAQSRMISAPKINNRVSSENNGITKQRRPRGLRAIVIEKDFEPENPIPLEKLTDKVCRWPIGHPNEKDFYFCGRSSMDGRVYCKLHVMHAYQPKGWKEEKDNNNANEELPEFIEKKIKTA